MITEQEAQDLMIKLIDLREKAKLNESISIKKELQKHEKICIEKFKYLVTMRTGRYKTFSNYDDLNQEGFEALIHSMANYNPTKGSFFWWAHKYIDTRISRSANLHTTIRYPLKVAKEMTPHKESIMPLLIEDKFCPEKELETHQSNYFINNALKKLTPQQREIINLAYGLDSDKPVSINKIRLKFNISRLDCIKLINNALFVMKENIKM